MLADAKLKTLANGVRVVTSHDPNSEITTVVVAFRAGTRGEKPGTRGIAHLAEHLVFKGTRKYPLAKDVNTAVSKIGAYINASTNIEYTYYILQVANVHAADALDLLAEMTLRPRVPKADFEAERSVVVDEMLQSHEDSAGQMEILFEDLMYKHQPLGWDIAGTRKSLKGIKHDDVHKWLHDWYVGQTCAVILVGGGAADLTAKATKAFSEVKRGRLPLWRTFKRIRNVRPIFRHRTANAELTSMMVGYPSPGFASPMAEPLRLLNVTLGVDNTSRLYDRLREQSGLAYDVSSITEMYSDTGHIAASVQVQPHHADEALRGILEEFRRLTVDPVTQDEFAAARETRLAHLKALMEDQEGLVKHYMKDLFIMKRIRPLKSIIKATESVMLDQVRTIAKRVFVPRRWYMATVGQRPPKIPKGL